MKNVKPIGATFLALGLTALMAPIASGVFTNPQVPTFRGTPNSQLAGWESFTSAFAGPNFADVVGSTATTATLTQSVPGAIVTSTGNIYHPSMAPMYTITDTAPDDLQAIVLQVSTWGSELLYANTVLAYTNGAGDEVLVPYDTYTELANYPAQGVNVESMFTWDLAADPELIVDYELRFEGQTLNISLDAVTLDLLYAGGTGTAYCFGDGSGTACPCGNNGEPGRGCGNGTNGNGAILEASGSTLVANGDLTLNGHDLPPGVPGLFFQGSAQVNGGLGNMFGDGLLCAGGGIQRLQVATADGFGDLSSSVNIVLAGSVSAGSTLNYQLWYRDAAGTPCGTGFNTTNAIEIVWQ